LFFLKHVSFAIFTAMSQMRSIVTDDLETTLSQIEDRRRSGGAAARISLQKAVDVEFKAIPRVVAQNHFVGNMRLSLHQRTDGIGDHLLGVIPHEQKHVFEQPEPVIVLLDGVRSLNHCRRDSRSSRLLDRR
jgi:hypothetical protein